MKKISKYNTENGSQLNIKAKTNKKETQRKHVMQWATKISHNLHLYTSSHLDNSNYHFFRVEFKQLNNLQPILVKKRQYIQFGCIIFDKQIQGFVGKTYLSEMFEVQSQGRERTNLNCQKTVFFYSGLSNAILKVDVWLLQSQKNAKQFQLMSKRTYLGNMNISLSENQQTGTIQSQLKTEQSNRFFDQNQIMEQKQNINLKSSKINKSSVTLTINIINSHSLTSMQYFIPPLCICDELDQILGLKDDKIAKNGQIVMAQRSSLRFQIKGLTIPRNAIKLTSDIAQQRIMQSCNVVGLASTNIKEIRMHVEFHNGWKSISRQTVVMKEQGNQSAVFNNKNNQGKTAMNSKRSNKIIETSGAFRKFYYEKAKELRPVFVKHGGVVIILVQIKIQIKYDIKEADVKKSKSQMMFLPLGFALKSLIDLQEETQLNIELKNGNPYNLQNLSSYLSELTKKVSFVNTNDRITSTITFSLDSNYAEMESIAAQIQKRGNEIQTLRAEKQRITKIRRKIKQQKRKKLIQLNQEIPFLQTINIKQKLFQQKIIKLKDQKSEKEQILSFLKTRINQIQRQALKYQFNKNEFDQDEDPYNSGAKLVQKLPQNFIDHKPDSTDINLNEGTILNIFNSDYCKKTQIPLTLCSDNLVQQCHRTPTYFSLKINNLKVFCQKINQFQILMPNFSGGMESTGLLTNKQQQNKNKTVEAKITFDKKQKTKNILNSMLNGSIPIYLQCGPNKKIMILTWLECGAFIKKCEQTDILFQSDTKTLIFNCNGFVIAQLNLFVSFSQSYRDQIPSVVKNQSKFITNTQQGSQLSILTRINRFKNAKGQNKDKKMQIIQKAVSQFHTQKISLNCNRYKEQVIKLRVINKYLINMKYSISIYDSDKKYLQSQVNQVQFQSAPIKWLGLEQNDNPKTKRYLQLNSNQEVVIPIIFYSKRMNINLNQIDSLQQQEIFDRNLYKYYNHQHKVIIQIAHKQTNIVQNIYQITVIPEYQNNVLFIQQFITEQSQIALPIPCLGLQLKNHQQDVTLTTTRLTLAVPKLLNSQHYISQFSLLKKSNQNLVQDLAFQNFQFLGWGCDKMQIQGRLWQNVDYLIKIPFKVILDREIHTQSLINSINVQSKNINLRFKQAGQFLDYITQSLTRKNNQIFIRSQISLESIGLHLFQIQISDQNQSIFHRIGIHCKVTYPTLANHQIISIKIPTQNLQQVQVFAYKNDKGKDMNFSCKSLQPHLLKFKQLNSLVQKGGQWKIQMMFDWPAIRQIIIKQQKDQCQLLIGIIGALTIDYILFKCRT